MQAQFQDGSISGWTLRLEPTSIDGTAYMAVPADSPAFSFPFMPSGKMGLKLHPGKFRQLQKTYGAAIFPATNCTNKYWLEKMVDTKGGEVTLKVLCPKSNNGFVSVYTKTIDLDKEGVGEQVATGYTTQWMQIAFTIPAGPCLITLFFSGDAMQSGADMSVDSFLLPE